MNTLKMKTSHTSLYWGALISVLFSTLFSATSYAKDAEILQLLQEVREGIVIDSRVNRKRINEFRSAQKEQKRLLREERALNARLQARSEELEKIYNDGENELTQVRFQFDERLGSLKELFGVLQAVSGDLRATLAASVTQAEHVAETPGNNRVDFLSSFAKRMSGTDQLPESTDIERLWLEMFAEIIASSEVKRFTAKVQKSDGSIVEQSLVRAGLFNVVGDTGYLSYRENQDYFNVLTRQPPGRYQGAAQDLSELGVNAEPISFPVDPTRGQLLSLLVELPTMGERIDQGGVVGYLILVLGLVAVILSVWRFMSLRGYRSSIDKQRENMANPDEKNPLGAVLAVYNKNNTQDLETLELKLEEAIMAQTPKFTKSLSFIKIIAVVAPLMGLLGTVTGMIITFQSITQFGAGDPKLMAGGISQALVTTVLGLVVAIPTVFLHSILSSQARSLTQFLEEKVVALVADYASDQK